MEKIYIVIRHEGRWDNYQASPIKAFTKKEDAEDFYNLCNKEVKRIIEELDILFKEYEDLFTLSEYNESLTDEEIDDIEEKYGKKSLIYWEKKEKIYKSHKYDEHIMDHEDLIYKYTEIELA